MKSFFNFSRGAKTSIALTLLMAFLVVILFGFLFMAHHREATMAHGPSSCIAGVFEGSDCPETTTPLDFILFHFKAFKTFSTALFSVMALVIVILTFAFFRIRERFSLKFLPVPSALHGQYLQSLSFPYRLRLRRWFALHKKRDPFRS